MEQIKMQPNTQFKINSVEELKQAYKYSKNPYKPIDKAIADYKHYPDHNYWKTNEYNESYLGYDNGFYKTIPNPFKSEYPKPMLVWDNVPQRKKVVEIIGKFHGQHMTKGEDDCIYGFKNAKDIDAPMENIINPKETTEDKIKSYLEAMNEKLSIIIENTN